jgi:hypothetical protein
MSSKAARRWSVSPSLVCLAIIGTLKIAEVALERAPGCNNPEQHVGAKRPAAFAGQGMGDIAQCLGALGEPGEQRRVGLALGRPVLDIGR